MVEWNADLNAVSRGEVPGLRTRTAALKGGGGGMLVFGKA
jgi:hypothetical protein